MTDHPPPIRAVAIDDPQAKGGSHVLACAMRRTTPLLLLAAALAALPAFVEFMLSEAGQAIAMERGFFPIVPRHRIKGPPGSRAELAVEFNGGVRSYFDNPVVSVYDDELAQRRYEQVDAAYRREIEVPGIRAEH